MWFPKINRFSSKCVLATAAGWSVLIMWFISSYVNIEFRKTTARVYHGVRVGVKQATEQLDFMGDDEDQVKPPDVKGHRCVPNNFVHCDDRLTEFMAWDRNQPKAEILSKLVNKSKVDAARFELHFGLGSAPGGEEDRAKFLESFTVDTGNPYHRINQKLNSGAKISIHMINLPAWLIWEISEPRCRRNLCYFDADEVTNNTDVVLINGIRLIDSLVPAKRWSHQLYVLYGREATVHFRSSLLNDNSTWRHTFNLTATYRQVSDLHWPYGGIKLKPVAPKKPDYLAIARNKTKTAVWLVSNCRATSIRNEYVKEMKKYIDVDIFGRCGNATTCLSELRGQCLLDMLRPYKFYLAFENAFCSDYLTEKIFKTFLSDNHIVPVVMGGTDYDKYFPKGSLINIDWFPTARELAVYLQSLDPETYSRYLEVKDMYETLPGFSILCQVCDALVKQSMKPKSYDIKYWLEEACPSPRSKF